MPPMFLMITPCARCHGALKIAAALAALGAPEALREKVADADDAGMAMAWLWFRWIPHGL